MKKISEVQDIVGLSKRAIQEYEKAGVAIKPTDKNKYGHLLYDEPEIERLWQLRFYKEMGYNIPKIKSIMEDRDYDLQRELNAVVASLNEKRKKLDNMIAIAKLMQETGANISTLRHSVEEVEEMNADAVFEIFGTAFNIIGNEAPANLINADVMTEDMLKNSLSLFRQILECCEEGIVASDVSVQQRVAEIHNIMIDVLSESVMFIQWSLWQLSLECKLAKALAEKIGPEQVAYIREAIEFYCISKEDNKADYKLGEAFDNIVDLGYRKYAASSEMVQTEVKKIHQFFRDIKLLTEEGAMYMMRYYAELFNSETYKKHFDNGAERGEMWFISRAIEIYCDGIKEVAVAD